MSTVVSRFAPSPTGLGHAGNYRTAIFAYLFAKHEKGKFIVRIEDTDAARSKQEYEANILETLVWLQLPADETYRQSEHRARHRELLEKLVAEDKAYVSKETPKNPGDREEVIRFRNQGGSRTFTDVIHGEITTDVSDLGDFIIARSFDEPVFHFAVVVDDADEKVTHVIRGGDHISNTARQMLIREALGFPEPLYAHLPLIMDGNHKKLSKRFGAKALTDYRDMGVLPEAMLNYVALLGWNPGDEREYLSHDELIKAFDISRVQKGSAVFDEVKLLSVNQHWMRGLSTDDFLTHLAVRPPSAELGGPTSKFNPEKLKKAVSLLKERTHSFNEAREMLSGELSCLFNEPTIDRKQLLAKEPPDRPGMTITALKGLFEPLKALSGGAPADAVKEAIMPLANAEEVKGKGGRGAVLWPLRYALSGAERSPDPFTLISILDTEETISRIRKAIAILEE
ncbi:MAG: glutamate--tRNA ligase family protein [Candidatus Kaiserbacteria bacterium]|nr:glutamate--tRNA ligase family protein [Candidatus Kaiserbacteria bacterium]